MPATSGKNVRSWPEADFCVRAENVCLQALADVDRCVLLLAYSGPGFLDVALYERYYFQISEDNPDQWALGYQTVNRWGKQRLNGPKVLWYARNGFLCASGRMVNNLNEITKWNPDGTIHSQIPLPPGQWSPISAREVFNPPWPLPAEAQSIPTAPCFLDA